MSLIIEKMTAGNPKTGDHMYRLIKKLYPICRSITGDGVRETLKIIEKYISLKITEVATGTKVFDWTIPKEWNIKDAYIKNLKGERIVDFKRSNLHVLNYSIPINKKVTLNELKRHLFTIPEHEEWIPYRTSYYTENWGFCMSHKQYLELKDEEYEVCIDSTLEKGHLTFGEFLIPGKFPDEVLISCHICHPSLCNDNLSGIAVTVFLARCLLEQQTKFSYRFVFIPATIGSITWLALNEKNVFKIKFGLVAANLGDSGLFTYKKSRNGNMEVDRVVINALRDFHHDYNIIDFFPYGYDERQYCSPGFNMPVGCLMRTPHGKYAEYHTSADNLHFVNPECLYESLSLYLKVVDILENNKKYLNKNLKCEPQLGKRGIYRKIGAQSDSEAKQLAMLWVLNLSDGHHSLLDISEKSQIEFGILNESANLLLKNGLLYEVEK
jgi:aminopeptidase-like protein